MKRSAALRHGRIPLIRGGKPAPVDVGTILSAKPEFRWKENRKWQFAPLTNTMISIW